MSTKYYIVNTEAAIYRDDKWLIIRRSDQEEHAPGRLGLVGGKVEGFTSCASVLERTLHREVLEEVGIEIIGVEYLESKAFLATDGQPVVDIVFICQHARGKASCVSVDEVAAVYWLTAAQVAGMADAPDYLKQTVALAEQRRLERQ